MEWKDYVTALTQIDGLLWQVIGAMKAEQAKKMPRRTIAQAMIHPGRT